MIDPKDLYPEPGSDSGSKGLYAKVKDGLSVLIKSSGLIVWFVIFVLALLEIKRYYNIDIIPGYNSSLDDVYGAMRGSLSELFK